MALAVPHVGGKATLIGAGDPAVSDSWTSTAGSLIVVIGFFYNTSNPAADGFVTDSKGNTYTLLASDLGGTSAPGIGVWMNDGGTRGASHTVTVDEGGAFQECAVIEITGEDATPFDTTTDATAADGTSPFTVTAAAAISGNQIAIYGCVVDSADNTTWTNPSGYSDIIEQGDGSSHLVVHASYKLNETGTPAVGASWGGTVVGGGARQVLVTFKEATAGPSGPPQRFMWTP